MGNYIDLHIHTYYSDGLNSPEEILTKVKDRNLMAFSICDHDNCGAYSALKKKLEPSDPELISGVELSAGKSGDDIHIIGYYFDPDCDEFDSAIESFRKNRNRRGVEMLNKLNKLGIEITMEMVREIAGDSAIGRPHVAEALYKLGAVGHYNQAFDKYIGMDGPAYVPKDNLTPEGAIGLIHRAGGLAILAHPGISEVYKYIDEFADHGLDGLEVFHPGHNKGLRKMLRKKAGEKKLIMTGGSDFHGRSDHHGTIGSQPVPMEFLLLMKERLN